MVAERRMLLRLPQPLLPPASQGASAVGSARVSHVQLLSGRILPYWRHLEMSLSASSNRADRRLRVVKVATTATPDMPA